MTLIAIIVEQEKFDRMEKAFEKVDLLEKRLDLLMKRPEMQQWISIAQICKDSMFGVKSYNAVKPILDEAIATKNLRTLNGKYNLNDLLVYTQKFQ